MTGASRGIGLAIARRLVTEGARVCITAPALSSVAKVYCSEAIYPVVDRSIPICGGVSDALPLSSYLNEVRPFHIYDGSTETHKWAIAKRASAARRADIADDIAASDIVVERARPTT